MFILVTEIQECQIYAPPQILHFLWDYLLHLVVHVLNAGLSFEQELRDRHG